MLTRLLVLALLAAGCAQPLAGEASLEYAGGSPGRHTALFDCGGTGTLTLEWDLQAGQVEALVRDGAGEPVRRLAAEGPGSGRDEAPLAGPPGGWTLEVERSHALWTPFNGTYAALARCGA